MKDKYTGGEWIRLESFTNYVFTAKVEGEPQKSIAEFDRKYDSLRAITCVNALNGISNTALSSGVVGEMVEVVKELVMSDGISAGSQVALDSILSKLEATD